MSDLKTGCPRRLKATPNEPCHVAREALERMAMGDEAGAARLCPWSIRDESSSLCFWKYMEIEGAPIENTKDIAFLLNTTKKKVDRDLASAMEKVSSSPDVREFAEIVAEISAGVPDDMDLYTEDDTIAHLLDPASQEILKGDRHRATHPDLFDGRKNRGRTFAPGQLIHHKGKRVNLGPLSDSHAKMMKDFNKKSNTKTYYSGSSDDPAEKDLKSEDEKE